MITVETIPHSGGLIVSALVGDGKACGAYLESHTFYGYGEAEAVRLFVERCHARGQRIDEDIVYEAPCSRCGAVNLTDEWHGGRPYFGSGCSECGGDIDADAWQVSDEPHPSVWGMS
ncbi:MAG: hypothetical protein EBZ61_08895 [Micrococcales bacterium]|nr:hypothetical protein [Micrococcales bacterium]